MWKRRRTRVFAVFAALLLASIAWAGARAIDTALSCLPVAQGAIAESPDFVPYDARITRPPDRPFDLSGGTGTILDPGDAAVPGGTLGGLPLRWVAFDAEGGVYQFFAAAPIDATTTVDGFTAAGGIRFNRLVGDGIGYIDDMLKRFPGRALEVHVGGNRGLLTWGDPDRNGVRAHEIYWTNGSRAYALIVDRPADEVVNLARSLVCDAGYR